MMVPTAFSTSNTLSLFPPAPQAEDQTGGGRCTQCQSYTHSLNTHQLWWICEYTYTQTTLFYSCTNQFPVMCNHVQKCPDLFKYAIYSSICCFTYNLYTLRQGTEQLQWSDWTAHDWRPLLHTHFSLICLGVCDDEEEGEMATDRVKSPPPLTHTHARTPAPHTPANPVKSTRSQQHNEAQVLAMQAAPTTQTHCVCVCSYKCLQCTRNKWCVPSNMCLYVHCLSSPF